MSKIRKSTVTLCSSPSTGTALPQFAHHFIAVGQLHWSRGLETLIDHPFEMPKGNVSLLP